jgi:hypothetical protein
MRTIVLAALLVALPSTANSQSAEAPCRPSAPQHPTNSEDYNPGLGGALGLNDDHEDVHPFGALLSEYYIAPLAQSGQPGAASYVGYVTGNDCARAEQEDE